SHQHQRTPWFSEPFRKRWSIQHSGNRESTFLMNNAETGTIMAWLGEALHLDEKQRADLSIQWLDRGLTLMHSFAHSQNLPVATYDAKHPTPQWHKRYLQRLTLQSPSTTTVAWNKSL